MAVGPQKFHLHGCRDILATRDLVPIVEHQDFHDGPNCRRDTGEIDRFGMWCLTVTLYRT